MTKKADKNDKDKKTTLPADGGTITTRVEQKQVEQRIAIGANVVYETIRREGEDELHRTAAALAWSALPAGLSLGFSFIAEALLTAYLPDAPWRPLISRLGYCVGFLIIILGRQQLFTENTLTVILPLLLRKDMATLLRVVRLWSVVLCANFVGTYFFAPAIGNVALFPGPVHQAFTTIGMSHLDAGFGITFTRAIFAGWLIALMVWLLPGAESARVSIVIIIT
jgi:formate-nitrite transporter family protein